LAASCVAVIAYGYIGGTGVTGGAHRYWTHRSYKAKLPLRILLAGLYLTTGMVNMHNYICRREVTVLRVKFYGMADDTLPTAYL
jgi:fatty-acid desaturase